MANLGSVCADKDFYATDNGKLVGPGHPLARKLVAKQGQMVPEVFVNEYKMKQGQDYDDVPIPEELTTVPKPQGVSDDVKALIAAAVAEALAEKKSATTGN